MDDNQYAPKFPQQALAHLSEELGEATAALGKTIRFGCNSFNPTVPPMDRELNIDWLRRQIRNVRDAYRALAAFDDIPLSAAQVDQDLSPPDMSDTAIESRTPRDAVFMHAAVREVQRARQKFPMPNTTLAALTEEVGELAKALMDSGEGDPKQRRDDIWNEAVQVAAMAMRVAIEGDPAFPNSGPGDNGS